MIRQIKHKKITIITSLGLMLCMSLSNAQVSSKSDRERMLEQLKYMQQREAELNKNQAENSSEATSNTAQNTTSSSTSLPSPGQKEPKSQEIKVLPKPLTPEQQSTVTVGELQNRAFYQMKNNMMPLTPKQIVELRKVYEQSKAAAEINPFGPPRPTSSSLMVDLSPGAAPPVVRLARGFVSTLVFLDETGSPWPVESVDLGNPQNYNLQWDKKSNILMIQANASHTSANLAVRLRGQNTPVMLSLLPAQKSVDFRVDMHVPGLGPNALPRENIVPNAPSTDLLQVLDGVPPSQAKQLNLTGGEGRIWLLNGNLYLRTKMTVISPAWTAVMTSTDGMHAYKMSPVPVILASLNGQMIRLRVKGLS